MRLLLVEIVFWMVPVHDASQLLGPNDPLDLLYDSIFSQRLFFQPQVHQHPLYLDTLHDAFCGQMFEFGESFDILPEKIVRLPQIRATINANRNDPKIYINTPQGRCVC